VLLVTAGEQEGIHRLFALNVRTDDHVTRSIDHSGRLASRRAWTSTGMVGWTDAVRQNEALLATQERPNWFTRTGFSPARNIFAGLRVWPKAGLLAAPKGPPSLRRVA
jgi:hypothetical protein